MSAEILRLCGVTVDRHDGETLGPAIAACGVLAAGLEPETKHHFDADAVRQRLQDTVQGLGYTPWVQPEAGAIDCSGLTASELASIWKECAELAGGVRLTLQSGAPPAIIGSFVGELTDEDAHFPPANGIASVVLRPSHLAEAAAGEPRWRWPLRIGVLPGPQAEVFVTRARTAPLVRRGLATVFELGKGKNECDLLLAGEGSARELGDLLSSPELQPGAIVFLGGVDASRHSSLRTELVLARLKTGAVAQAVVPSGTEDAWTEALLRSLAHNKPLDVSLWHADTLLRKFAVEPGIATWAPVRILGILDFLAETRLDRYVERMANKLKRLPPNLPVQIAREAAERLLLQRPRSMPAPELADLLESRHYYYNRESDEAAGVAALEPAVEAAVAEAEDKSLPRYADLTLFELERGERRRLPDTTALLRSRSYQLEVAIRAHRTGISYLGDEPEPVVQPPSKEDVEIMAVLIADEDDFDIPEPVQPITLPPGKDSSVNAMFQITPKRRSSDPQNLPRIDLYLYYELNMIEHVVFSPEVLEPGENPAYAEIGLGRIEQKTACRSYEDLEENLEPREMSIDVERQPGQYRLTFAVRGWKKDGGETKTVVFPGRIRIPDDGLTKELNRIRETWYEIAISRYSAVLEGPDPIFRSSMRELARRGRDLWSLLFRGDSDAAMSHIGKWLRKHPPKEGALIEVNLKSGAEGFVFPWALLYDERVPRDETQPVKTDRFWGLRYAIEQRLGGFSREVTDRPIPVDNLKLGFMLYPFPNAADQQRLMEEWIEESQKRLEVTLPPIQVANSFYEMIESCDSHILYFYTHGHTQSSGAYSGVDGVKLFKRKYEALPEGSVEREELAPFYKIIGSSDFKEDESWIGLPYGKILLKELMAEEMRLTRSPVVFLNMCQSAQLLPTLSESFVSLFLGRKARSVIGTECPMTTKFAHPFSERVLRALMEGKPIGGALLEARRAFMKKRNPLGLAYTLFGSATTQYEPAILKPVQQP